MLDVMISCYPVCANFLFVSDESRILTVIS